ncbi:hypothetical protein OROHE_014850 [Orobanche hederae]
MSIKIHDEQQQHEQKQLEKSNVDGIIILGVNIHCEGCANDVLKCLRGFEGVEVIEIDAKNHKVNVKGKKADPIKVADRVRKKTGKHVELISPKPKKQVKEEKKPEPEPKVIEVVLKVYMHCEGCAKDVKHCIHDMKGVQTVDPEMTKNLVTVKGTMDPEKLVEFISKRCGRHATIVKQNLISKEIKKKDDCSNHKDDNCCYLYISEQVYAPQLFSDENPNFCSIM